MDKSYNLSLVSLTANGKIRKNKKLKVGLYRVNWRWWWDSGSDNVTNYSSSTHYGAVTKADLTTNSKGKVDWNIKVADWGRYMVRVCDEETGHCTGDIFYALQLDITDAAIIRWMKACIDNHSARFDPLRFYQFRHAHCPNHDIRTLNMRL